MLRLAKSFQKDLNEIAEKVEASNQRWYKFISTGNADSKSLQLVCFNNLRLLSRLVSLLLVCCEQTLSCSVQCSDRIQLFCQVHDLTKILKLSIDATDAAEHETFKLLDSTLGISRILREL